MIKKERKREEKKKKKVKNLQSKSIVS